MKILFLITAPIIIFLYSCGDFPPYKEVVVSATTIPSNPTGVTAAAGDRQVTISWSSVSGATSYNLYWSINSGAGKSGTKITGVISPYTHIGLTNDTTYYYVVTAVNSIGESEASSQVSATPTSGGGGTTTTTTGSEAYEVEPNNSLNQAQLINADTYYIGDVGDFYDPRDYFKIVTTGNIMTITISLGRYLDVSIYTSSGVVVSNFNTYPISSKTIGVTSGQTYYIRIYGEFAYGDQQYKLKASFS